ncbi:MAG: hypothetical protein Q4G62_11200 [Pseudomonadota bacterium]|nr:hypothetical protein [Pseudomonadota bacterium]
MRAIFIAAMLALTACSGERIGYAPQPGDVHHLPAIEWRVVDQRELERIYRDSGMTLGDKQKLQGFVGTRNGQAVIYTLPPTHVDDAATLTLGHEILHVAIGDYHR